MSELIKRVYQLAKETHHSVDYMLAEYAETFKIIEKQHQTCYGMAASLRSKQPNYCMNCIGEQAVHKMEEYYRKGC